MRVGLVYLYRLIIISLWILTVLWRQYAVFVALCPTYHRLTHASLSLFQNINLKNEVKAGGGYHVQL
jgi:hypothetical protein